MGSCAIHPSGVPVCFITGMVHPASVCLSQWMRHDQYLSASSRGRAQAGRGLGALRFHALSNAAACPQRPVPPAGSPRCRAVVGKSHRRLFNVCLSRTWHPRCKTRFAGRTIVRPTGPYIGAHVDSTLRRATWRARFGSGWVLLAVDRTRRKRRRSRVSRRGRRPKS